MTIEKLTELGWKQDGTWNNRVFFALSKDSKYSIFEHDGIGLLHPYNKNFELIYCDLTDEEIVKYTEMVKTIENIVNHPKDNSLYDYCVAEKAIVDFVKEMQDRS